MNGRLDKDMQTAIFLSPPHIICRYRSKGPITYGKKKYMQNLTSKIHRTYELPILIISIIRNSIITYAINISELSK